MTGWTRMWRQLPRALRARYTLAPVRLAAGGMTLLNPRRPSLHIRPRLTIQASWNLAANLRHIHETQVPRPALPSPGTREVVRELISSSSTSSFGWLWERWLPQSAHREIVPEAGSAPPPSGRKERSIATLGVIRRHTSLEELAERTRRIALTTEVARAVPGRLRANAVRNETRRLEPARMVEAAPARIAPANGPAGETEAPHRVAQWPSTPPRPPEVDVDSITNHVIQQLDHRLIAFRERMGRV